MQTKDKSRVQTRRILPHLSVYFPAHKGTELLSAVLSH